jgi:hypothetical protein
VAVTTTTPFDRASRSASACEPLDVLVGQRDVHARQRRE